MSPTLWSSLSRISIRSCPSRRKIIQAISQSPNGFLQVEEEHSTKLKKTFNKEEIQRAVFEMVPFKSLGNDRLHAGFYQHTWETVGDNLCKFVANFLDLG